MHIPYKNKCNNHTHLLCTRTISQLSQIVYLYKALQNMQQEIVLSFDWPAGLRVIFIGYLF